MKTKTTPVAWKLEMISTTADQASLTKVQAKINQYNTNNLLIKYNRLVVGDKLVFEIVLKKTETTELPIQ